MAFGLGALLVLERRDRAGDAWACVLLVLSLTFSELGIPFIIGVAVVIALDRGPWRRAYVVAVPLVLYAIWYLGWGHTATSYLSFHNVANSPAYVLDGFASSIGSLLGLSTPPITGGTGGVEWGRPLLVGLVVLAAVRLWRLGRFPATLWVPLAIGVSFWFLTAANTGVEPSADGIAVPVRRRGLHAADRRGADPRLAPRVEGARDGRRGRRPRRRGERLGDARRVHDAPRLDRDRPGRSRGTRDRRRPRRPRASS